MCDTTFTIGQRGGYLFECPSKRTYDRLPRRVQALFVKDEIASVYNLFVGQDNVFFISYRGNDGLDHFRSDGLPERLRDFLTDKDTQGSFTRSFPNLRVTLGSGSDSFFVTDGTNSRWTNLPTDLSYKLDSLIDTSGKWIDMPRLVVLGAHEDYLMITKRNAAAWFLNGYRELKEYLEGFKTKGTSFRIIHNVFLNPYRLNNWILQGTNGTVIGGGMPTFAQGSFDIMKASIRIETRAKLLRDLEALKDNQPAENVQTSLLVTTNRLMQQQLKTNEKMSQANSAQTASSDTLKKKKGFSNPFDMSAFWQPLAEAANS